MLLLLLLLLLLLKLFKVISLPFKYKQIYRKTACSTSSASFTKSSLTDFNYLSKVDTLITPLTRIILGQFIFYYQILTQPWKNKQNWTRTDNFDICFCVVFLTASVQQSPIEERLDTRLCPYPNLRFSCFLISQDLYSVVRQLVREIVSVSA